MSFKEIDQVKFELTSTFTWGVQKDKYSGYSIPVALDDETAERIEDLVQEHGTKSPLYGHTLYLKSKNLSEKQKNEVYNKGKAYTPRTTQVTLPSKLPSSVRSRNQSLTTPVPRTKPSLS